MTKIRLTQNCCCCATPQTELENLYVFLMKGIVASRIPKRFRRIKCNCGQFRKKCSLSPVPMQQTHKGSSCRNCLNLCSFSILNLTRSFVLNLTRSFVRYLTPTTSLSSISYLLTFDTLEHAYCLCNCHCP